MNQYLLWLDNRQRTLEERCQFLPARELLEVGYENLYPTRLLKTHPSFIERKAIVRQQLTDVYNLSSDLPDSWLDDLVGGSD